MKLITTHVGADFDSLASMVAVRKLYREGTLCFSGAASRNVRDFLKRHAGRLRVTTPRKVSLEEVDTLIVVDARSLGRIGPFAALARVGCLPADALPTWNAVIGLRNRIVHDYMNVDMEKILTFLRAHGDRPVLDFLRAPLADKPNAP